MTRRRNGSSAGVGARLLRRLSGWAADRCARVAGYNPWQVGIEAARGAGRHRVTGIAAEMAFFAALGLVPLTVAFGAALGYAERLLGADRLAEGRDAAIVVLTALLGPELTADTVAPFVHTLLERERGGLAAGSLLLALWLGSRMFTPALHVLDLAHGAQVQRSEARRRLVSLGLAVGSLLASALTLAIMVLGPLLGTAQALADQIGLGGFYRAIWTVGRWPVLLVILTGFVVAFHRFAPSARMPWRACLPGAVVGVAVWITVALGFRLYVAAGGRGEMGGGSEDEVLIAVGRAVSAVVATMLWTFLSSVAILFGGEVNAAVQRRRSSGLRGT